MQQPRLRPPWSYRQAWKYLRTTPVGRAVAVAAALAFVATLFALTVFDDRDLTIAALVVGGALVFVADVWRGARVRDLDRDRGKTGFIWFTAASTCAGGVLAGACFGLLEPKPSVWLRVFGALCAAALTAYPLLNEDFAAADRRYSDTLVSDPAHTQVLSDFNLVRLANLALRSTLAGLAALVLAAQVMLLPLAIIIGVLAWLLAGHFYR